MRWVKRALLGIAVVIFVATVSASMWFWFVPVGINNYINKVTFKLAIDSHSEKLVGEAAPRS